MKSGTYIASARTLGMLLLVIVYFGFSQASSHANQLNRLKDAREAFAAEIVLRYLKGYEGFQAWLEDLPRWDRDLTASSRNTPIFNWLEEHPSRHEPPEPPLWARSVRISVVDVSSGTYASLFSSPTPAGVYFEVQVEESETENWFARPGLNFDYDLEESKLHSLALQAGLLPGKDEDLDTLFWRLQNELIAKDVALPGSGISFRVGQVVWIAVIATLVILVVLRNRVRYVFRDSELGAGVPWLVLDAKGGLAGRIAEFWIVALFVGPWVQGMAALVMAVLEIRMGTLAENMPLNMGLFVSLLTLVIATNWISLITISDLLCLRRYRFLE